MTGFRAVVLPLALTLAVSACSIFPPPVPPAALHDLGPMGTPGTPTGSTWSTVVVDAPQWLQEEHIRYRLTYADPTRVGFYTRDRWLAPASSLLAQRLSVAGAGGGYELHIQLLEFEQVFDSPRNARAVLGFRIEAQRPEDGRVAGAKTFRLSLATPSADADGAVSAFSALAEQAIIAISTWLAQLPAHTDH
jgi:cholesterol transport system auxiliary component